MNEKKLQCNSNEKKDQETFSVVNGEKPYNNYTGKLRQDPVITGHFPGPSANSDRPIMHKRQQ